MGVSVHVATNRVTEAIDQLLRTPEVIDAMAAGELDERRAAIITEETEFLNPESAAAVVGLLAPRWRGQTAGPLRRLTARLAAQVDPEAVAAHAAEARERRGLTRRLGVDGTDHWRGDFLVEQSRSAWAAVTELGRRLVREGHADNLEKGRADALMQLVLEHCDVKVVLHATHAGAVPKDGSDADRPEAPARTSATRDTSPTTSYAVPSPHAPTHAPDGATRSDSVEGPAADTHDRGSTARAAGVDAAPDPAHRCATPEAGGVASALVEVGGLGAPGTTFVTAGWVQGALTAADGHRDPATAVPPAPADTSDTFDDQRDPETAASPAPADASDTFDAHRDPPTTAPQASAGTAGLVCHPVTGALIDGEVPASLSPSGTSHSQKRAVATAMSTSYRPPTAMRRFVLLRDGSCRFPGCSTPARQCDLDHVRPWPDGPTASLNLIALCRRHHRIKQRDGWLVMLERDGRVRWRDPSGREHLTWPVDHLHLMKPSTPRRTEAAGERNAAHLADAKSMDSGSSFEEELAALLQGESQKAQHREPGKRRHALRVAELERGMKPDPSSDLGVELVWPGPPWDTLVVDVPPLPPLEPEPIPF